MHNIIIETECDAPVDDDHPINFQGHLAEIKTVPTLFVAFLWMHEKNRDTGVRTQLRNDLVEHLWVRKGNDEMTHDSLQFIFILVRKFILFI
jgi:hypothetical protein